MDSDSDDSLLAAPVFAKKRTRKETAQETKRTNLLDDMFTQQEEQISRRRRMDETIKKEQEGFVPSEEDKMLSFAGIAANGKEEGNNSNSNVKLELDGIESTNSSVSTFKNNFDDPSYKARIEAIKEKSRKAALAPHESRRQLLQKIDGMYDDDEFGLAGNADVQTEAEKERRLAEIEGRHSTLGMRRILGWNIGATEEGNEGHEYDAQLFAPYGSLDDALVDLDALLNKYDIPPQRQLSHEHKDQWNSVRNMIIKPLKQAKDMDILPHMLSRHWKSSLDVPQDLIGWLVRVATTGNMVVNVDFGKGACDMILNLMKGSMKVVNLDGDEPLIIAKIFQISDLVPILQSNYGLWKVSEDPKASADGKTNGYFKEPSGLSYAIKIWNAAIVNNFVAFSYLEKSKSYITQSISAVLFCEADPIFHSGYSLLDIGTKCITLLIKVVNSLITQKNSPPSSDKEKDTFEDWIGSCVGFVMESFKQYSKLPSLADEEARDDTGWLLIEIVIRSWNSVEDKQEHVMMFYSSLCNAVLGKCFEGHEWDEELQRVVLKISTRVNKDRTDSPIPLRYKTIATAETALDLLARPGSTFLIDNPLLLATIRIANICEQVGFELFNHNVQNQDAPSVNRGFCESDAEAAMLYEHLDCLCKSLQLLKRSIKVVVNKPFIMRAKELVLLLLSTTDKQRQTVQRWEKGRKSDGRRQSDLSCFMKPKQEVDSDSDGEM